MNVVSFFAGCGGLDLGFEKAGFRVVWANEFEPSVHATYEKNHPNTILCKEDIISLAPKDVPDCDGFIGGPPCQSWSVAGKQQGLDDKRGQLFLTYIGMIRAKMPKFFVIENVKGLLDEKFKDVFETFLAQLDEIGYDVKYRLLDAVDYEVPQNRERVFLIGFRHDLGIDYHFPQPSTNKPLTLKDAIGDITATPLLCEEGEVMTDCNSYYNGKFGSHYYRGNRRRGWDKPSFTIHATGYNIPLHPSSPSMIYNAHEDWSFIKRKYREYRRLTVRECARIQTFPDSFEIDCPNIIDDEADQASLNSYGRKNSKKAEDEEEEKSATYDSIIKMRNALPGNTYIQYTATPQANILISMKDMLSPKSHTLLTPGEGYIGGKLYFGRGENHDLFRGKLIQQIPNEEVFHKTKNPLDRMPKSLKDALLMHILAVTIVVKYLRRDGVGYLSMMVHPATEKKYNSKFKKWIDAQLKSWRKSIRKDDGNDDKRTLIQRLRELFPAAIEFYNVDERPDFDELIPLIQNVLCSWKVYLVNTDKDAQTEIEWDEYAMHVLVGAEMLNRGFTVENLATTYMPRYSTGPANADTIQQRCRFFGYKRDYIESCRVYLPSWTMNDYKAYIDHEEELRSVLATCDNLAAAERKILLSPRMRATRANVLPITIVNSQLKGVKEMQAYESKERIEQNRRVAEAFIERHIEDFNIEEDYHTDDRCHRGFRMPVDEAIEFLDDFQFGNYKDATRKAATIRYLRYLADKEDEPLQFVYFYQMAYKRIGANLRSRNFDYNTLRITVPLATGRSTSGADVYPGDLAIVGSDSITIQLYHIKLDGVKPVDYPDDAYSLAISYPESFATNYVLSEQANQEDEDVEDDD